MATRHLASMVEGNTEPGVNAKGPDRSHELGSWTWRPDRDPTRRDSTVEPANPFEEMRKWKGSATSSSRCAPRSRTRTVWRGGPLGQPV